MGAHKVMNWSDWTTILSTPVVTLLGIVGIAFVRRNWIAEFLANKYLEKRKHEMQQELESHKTKLRKSEFLFQKEFDAASAFISLSHELLPDRKYSEMECRDTSKDLAQNFELVENALNSYIATHGAALKNETLERLISTKRLASNSRLQFEVSGQDSPQTSIRCAGKVMKALKEIEKELRQTVQSQSDS